MNKIKYTVLAAFFLLACVSCNKELDEAPVLTFDGERNMTIAELLELHTVGTTDSYSEIPEGTIITGIVTSSDKQGNCYKYLTIQDETGAIMIKIDDSSLDPKYRIGQRVYVKCGDMVIGDYRKNKQLGFWVDGSMTGIASSQEDLYIFRDGVCGAEPEPVVVNSKYQIDESMCNKLIKLEGVHFDQGGTANYCDAGSNTSRDIVFADNSTIVLRTSSYAKFANDLLPEGEGDLYGILTIYNTTYQFTIRSLDDVRFGNSTPHQVFEEIYNADLSQDLIGSHEWNVFGDEAWFYYALGPTFAAQSSSAADSWLVSPTFSCNNYQDVFVAYEDLTSLNANVGLYYSTSFTGNNFAPDQWTPCSKNTPIPDEITHNSNFRIAFRYNDNGAWWKISSVQLKGTKIQ